MKHQIVAYRRVSSIDQNLDRQDFGPVDRIFEDKASGKDTKRPGLQEMISYVREGDEVRVWSIDRLGRSLTDLHTTVKTLTDKGVKVVFLSEKLTFSNYVSDPFADLQFTLLGAFSQFERSISERRRLEGMAAARTSGRYKKAGRKRKEFDVTEAKRLRGEGMSLGQICDVLGCSKTTLFRELEK